MKTPRHGIGAAVLDGKVYVRGGATREGHGPGGEIFEGLVLEPLSRLERCAGLRRRPVEVILEDGASGRRLSAERAKPTRRA
jgi:hypothetical protein